jgi:hypothetical protein
VSPKRITEEWDGLGTEILESSLFTGQNKGIMENMFYGILPDFTGFLHEMFYTCFTVCSEMFYTSMINGLITKDFGYVFNCNRL